MIKPADRRHGPDWFWVSCDIARDLARRGIPGLVPTIKAGVQGPDAVVSGHIHRNILPLIESSEAARLTLEFASRNPEPRDALVARLAERGITPRATQLDAAEFLGKRRGALLGDDMRLGKTLSALMAHDPADGPLVVVAPLPARGVWLGWMRKLWPDTEIGVFTGTKFDTETAKKPLVFAHYDILRFWQRPSEYGRVVFDEAHALTNHRTKRAIAASIIAANARNVVAMTGTPVWDLPPDFWMILSLVAPKGFGGFYDFANRYGAPESSGYGTIYTGLSHGPELRARLGEIMLRRKWMDVTEEMSPISRSVIIAPVPQAERNKLDVLAGQLLSERANTAAHLAAYRRQVTGVKLKTVTNEAARLRSAGHPVVVWTWHKDFANQIARDAAIPIDEVWVIHGDIAAAERDRRIEAWRQCSNGLLVATMAVGQVGIDLSHSPTARPVAIFAELDYTPAVVGQAEMRTFPSHNPQRGMDIIFVVADHLTDQRIIRALITKLSAADPLGVGAAVDSIDALRTAIMGPDEVGDVDRLMEDFLASA